MNPCKVSGSGKAWRVVEANGEPVMAGRVPADGGVVADETAAWQLADRINARRRAEAQFAKPPEAPPPAPARRVFQSKGRA